MLLFLRVDEMLHRYTAACMETKLQGLTHLKVQIPVVKETERSIALAYKQPGIPVRADRGLE